MDKIKKKSFNSFYDDDAEFFAKRINNRVSKKYIEYLYEKIKSSSLPKGSFILEIGAGVGLVMGRLASFFKEYNFIGVEPLLNYCVYAREQNKSNRNVFFVNSTIEESLKAVENILRGKQVSFFYSANVLHHVESVQKTIENITVFAGSRTRWCVIEPNSWNIYLFLVSAFKYGEKNFFKGKFLKEAKLFNWENKTIDYLTVIPSCIKTAPKWVEGMEYYLERFMLLGGSVILNMQISKK